MIQSCEQAKASLLALKNGVVPETVATFGIQRDEILEEFHQLLQLVQNDNGMMKFIVGEYGSGKSFMLKQMENLALEQNYVVANIQIEKGVRLNDFQTLYYHIMHSLTTKGATTNKTSFQDLFTNWLRSLKDQDQESSALAIQSLISMLNDYHSSYSRALLFYIRARIQNDHELANAVTSWLTGEQNIPASIKKRFEVVGKIDHTNAMDFMKAFIKLVKLLGYNGLIILVDELEVVMSYRSDIRMQAYQNLRYLIDNSYNNQLSNCLFVFASTTDWLENEEKGPKSYQALFQRIGEGGNGNKKDIRQPIIRLKKLNVNEIQRLTKNIVELFNQAYDFKLKISQQSLQNWVLLLLKKEGIEINDITVRSYVIKLIEVLDLSEQNPNSIMFKTELKAVTDGDTVRYVQKMRAKAEKI
ncbi:hypothetical protein BKP35_10160 [Anaerobacillus arseniciselenatis]|uniref:Biotin carboxylase n=1 Tax=Anaerobacillus arseniciselenatis TaxID=85682 RepID=A0A1S2LK54_9BACI|nr:BREX system ATP-binding domain-containing protein [Anaerobacillus arseniciselenatis]OIJ12918.1 hypothetical protein BKP35_10160 [Anaerobacillus arseniciselenatis]